MKRYKNKCEKTYENFPPKRNEEQREDREDEFVTSQLIDLKGRKVGGQRNNGSKGNKKYGNIERKKERKK